ncbi:carbohydrate ABC transporter permease [Desertihabitans aurantiacus]|uniref:carbohydrate ABC transporter permease n=1 Tax=Desertihabitans aurantiacus TaxID=2282477 RepID=UPI000DF7E029|nr:carbohydrate ABC transporter permease [Desertihabitans aurantiacus]
MTVTLPGPKRQPDPVADPAPDRLRRRRGHHPDRPAWEEEPKAATKLAKIVFLCLVVLAVLFPLWTVVITSFSTQEAITAAGGLVVVPTDLSLNAYQQILAGGVVTRAVGVSVFVTVVGTAISLIVSILGAYALSRPGTLLHKPILFLVLITMFFGAGMIPTYLLVSSLGLIDTLWALILPTSVSAFNVLIMRNFFMNVDRSMIDSARIDGAGEWRILFQIVLPVSKAVVAVIGLFYGVAYWNAFFNALLYINDTTKWPLQLVLRSYVLQGQAVPGAPGAELAAEGVPASLALQMAVVVLAMVPVLLVYPFIQKHFATGVMIGAVKG